MADAKKPLPVVEWLKLPESGDPFLEGHKCQACGYTFNGKTGLPNTTAITLYLVIGAILGLIAGFAIFFLMKF